MSEASPPPLNERVAKARIETRRRISPVWIIPLVALVAGLFVAWRTFAERGPAITITFQSAEGLEAGKTKIKYKDVEVGIVETIHLAPDLATVECQARMVRSFSDHLTDGTRFWVVRARVAGGQVSGLGTLFSGAYIGVDPVSDGKRQHEFVGLEVAPVVTAADPGRHFVLRSYTAGAVEVGTPVSFRKIEVGRVVASELDAGGEFVTVQIFVHAPHDQRVRRGTRFWNASGIDISMSAEGVSVDTESVASILIGGIAFDSPPDAGAPAPDGTEFHLYENREASRSEVYTRKASFLLHFTGSVRGLTVGAPVELRGIRIGQVTDVKLEFDRAKADFQIPVVIELELDRIDTITAGEDLAPSEVLEHLVRDGLRAQLKSGNLITGQLVVALDMHTDAPPAEVVWSEPYPEIPTIPTPLEEITASITRIAQRLERVPLEDIGKEMRASLTTLEATLEQVRATVASADDLVDRQSPVQHELRRALVELSEAARALGLAAEQLERQPESLIFGREGEEE